MASRITLAFVALGLVHLAVIGRVQPSAYPVAVALLVLSAVTGLVLARLWARPLTQLSRAAGELGRGRFDIRVPESRIGEVRQIGAALQDAARGLEARVGQERAFLGRASHAVRTPLTGLRLELEDLQARSDVAADVRATAGRCLTQVDRLQADTDAVLAEASGVVYAGQPTASLGSTARAVTDRWARVLAPYDSTFRSFLEGDPAVPLTPGFVEQVLDSVLTVLVAEGTGQVTLRFTGEDSSVRIEVTASGGGRHDPGRLARAEELTEAVGGTMSGDPFGPAGLRILLPGR